MKTDKELLELAAKACGLLKGYCNGEFTNFGVFLMPVPERPDFSKPVAGEIDVKAVELIKWNPFTDDGDAFRLAVKLDMCIYVNRVDEVVSAQGGYHGEHKFYENFYDDMYAATRRVIVRAAAAIGE